MTVSDQSRHQLHQRLDEVLGVDEAATLMAHLPPVGWADVATKRDLDHLLGEVKSNTKVELANVWGEFGQVRAEFGQVRAEFGLVRADIAGVRAELHQEVGRLRGELRGQMQTLFLGLVGLQMTAAGVAVALSRLL